MSKTVSPPSPRVLVVDDDFATRLLYHEALEPAGFHVDESEDGLVAIEKYQSTHYDVILLDVIMPNMNGFETCEALKKLPNWTDTPIVMVTGLDDFDSIEKANHLGATDFITKPISWPVLKHRLKFILKANSAFKELIYKQTQLNNAQRIAKLGSWEWDIATQQGIYSNECLNICELTKDTAANLSLTELLQLIHPKEKKHVQQTFIDAWQDRKNFNIDTRLLLETNKEIHIRSSVEFIIDNDGSVNKLTGTIQDTSDNVKAEEKIRHLAYFDTLTGLPNRQLFREHLKLSLKQAKREQHPIYIMFLDMDNFKHVNDSLGHDAGDQLLKDFAHRLQEVTRDTDFTARSTIEEYSQIEMSRLGGDEFTILLQNITEPRAASIVAKRIIDAMSNPFEIKAQDVFVSTSIGISVFPEDGNDAETLIKHADVAMYHAKSSGKNNYQFFNADMNIAALNRLTQENELRKAIDQNEFELYFQPRVDLDNNSVVSAEALIRWNHPIKGFVLPNDFIPLAEESRLIIPMGEWVLKAACKQIKLWEERHYPPLPISVNISPLQFLDGNLYETVTKAIESAGISPTLLELEITESALMENLDQTIKLMNQFRDLGVRLAIDDFGTGYSVLNTLRTFPLDVLKIDQSFIHGLPHDKACMVIAEAIIHMAEGLELDVVAEGVETQQQLKFLQKYKCVQVQGYYFSRPVPAKEMTEKLLQRVNQPELVD